MVVVFQFMVVFILSKLTICNNKLEKTNAKFYLLFNKKGGFKYTSMTRHILKVIKTFVKILLNFFILKIGRVFSNQPPIAPLLYAFVGQLPHNIKNILFGKQTNGILLIKILNFFQTISYNVLFFLMVFKNQ